MTEHQQCFDLQTNSKNVQKCILDGHSVVVILRGVTGSGKSTLAVKLTENAENFEIVSIESKQNKNTTSELVKKLKQCFDNRVSAIIIDAENTIESSVKSFAQLAVRDCYEFYVLEPDTQWSTNAESCFSKSSRNQSIEEISKKLEDLEESRDFTFKKLLGKEIKISIQPLFSLEPSCSNEIPNITKNPAYQPLFSLSPLPPKMKETRDFGMNVSFVDIAGTMAGTEGPSIIEWTEPTSSILIVPVEKIVVFDRTAQVQFENSLCLSAPAELLEVATLYSVFPHCSLKKIYNLYQMIGFETTYQVLKEGHEYMDPLAVPSPDIETLLEYVTEEESSTIRVKESKFEMYQQCRMEIAILNTPNAADNYNFPSLNEEETLNDEMLAMTMQEELDREGREVPTGRLTHAQKESLKILKNQFKEMRPEDVESVYETERRNFENTRSTLLIFTGRENEVELSPKKPSKKQAQPVFVPLIAERPKYTFETHLKTKETILRAQEEVKKKYREHDKLQKEFNAARQCMSNDLAERIRTRMMILREKINEEICSAHSDPRFLDLHHMTSERAVEFFEENYRKTRKGECMVVITGAGRRSNRFEPKILLEVKKHLNSKNIKFSMMNEGCIRVRKS